MLLGVSLHADPSHFKGRPDTVVDVAFAAGSV
jgi:hypothetical protein